MATVQVATWEEFLAAVTVAGDTVECPQGAEWDLSGTTITELIEINCDEIIGNNTTIKNATFQIAGNCIRNNTEVSITELHWDSITAECVEVFWHEPYVLEMNRCKISGEFIRTGYQGLDVFYGVSNFTSCSINAVCPLGGNLMSGNNPTHGISKYCRYRIYTDQTASNPFIYDLSPFNFCERCELIISAPNASRMAFSIDRDTYKLSECVVRGSLGEGSTAGYWCACEDRKNGGVSLIASTLNANDHDADEYSDYYNGVICTDQQLRSAAYITERCTGREWANFPLGDDDDEWHTGDVTINGGYPYIPLMIDLPRIELHPVPQTPYITVHSIESTQQQLANTNKNGLAILTPTSCEVTEELNGAYTFTMTHPIDTEGKWQNIQLRNIVKIDGQYFTILNTVITYTNNSGSIQCSGEHIFYQQNDSWIFPGDIISGANGSTFINNMDARTTTYGSELASMVYQFSGNSDLHPSTVITKDVGEGCTPIDALIGSGGLIDQSGTGCAELYRYNFYYSINERMEFARDNAFDIRIGRDLKGITRNFDTSQFVSYFRAYGQGGWWAVAWKLTDFLARRFPHHIIRSKNFMDIEPDEFFWENLINQGRSFFRRNAKPIIGWEIDLEDVRSNPDFSCMATERLKVGDSGTIFDERFGGALIAKISGTVYDAVRDKIIRVTIGDKQGFSSPAASTVDIEPENIGGDLWIQDANGDFILDADGKQIIQEVRYENG